LNTTHIKKEFKWDKRERGKTVKKEEGTMTHIINERDIVCERSLENHNQNKEYRSSQGGQQDKEKKGTNLHLFLGE